MEMHRIKVFLISLLFSCVAFAQTNPNPTANVATNNGQFQLSARILPIFGSANNGTVVATDLGGMFAITTTASLRSDNVLISTGGQGYFGGLQYFLPSKGILAKTNFDPTTFQFYLTGSGGLVNYNSAQHAGFLVGGGVNYDPTHTSRFTVNLVEVRIARMPGVHTGVFPLVAGGVSLGW